mgnify:CR=1 FL=1
MANMLNIYRRHVKACPHKPKGRAYRHCKCPIWVDGSLDGNRIHQALDLRDWKAATTKIQNWEVAGTVVEEKPRLVEISTACVHFMEDARARHLSDSSLKKYRLLLTNEIPPEDRERFSPSLVMFCREKGVRFVQELDMDLVHQFRCAWRDGAVSSQKKLERMRSFWRWLVDQGWSDRNYAAKLRPPKITAPPTMPFTQEEMIALLKACAEHGGPGQLHYGVRLRSLVLLARYSGLRIGDAASCAVDRLQGDRLFLYTHKTRVMVYCRLPQFVVEALEATPRVSANYWFWTGHGTKDTLTSCWRRSFRKVCKAAGIVGGHPHRLRDTFAVELLLAGVPIERVSVLLGHTSVRTTEKHYAAWVQARQAQVEQDLALAWAKDPIAAAAEKSATYPLRSQQEVS